MQQVQNKIKVLSFIDWFRPGYKAGGIITAFENLTNLLNNHVDFYIVTRDKDYCTEYSYQNIKSNQWNKLNNINIIYLTSEKLKFSVFQNLLNELKPDCIYINGMYSIFFSILPLFLKTKAEIIINPHGMLSKQSFTKKSLLKKIFLFSMNLLKKYSRVNFHCSNQNEVNDVKNKIWNYNSIETTNQPLKTTKSYTKFKKTKDTNKLNLIWISRISPEKGLSELLHLIKNINNINISIDIYGPIYDHNYWIFCQNLINKLPKNININYKGIIKNDKVVKTLRKYDFFILLSKGESFGHIIFESLLAGTPVIISNQTPWINLEQQGIGWEIPPNNSLKLQNVFEKCLSLNQYEYNYISKTSIAYAREIAKNSNTIDSNLKIFNK